MLSHYTKRPDFFVAQLNCSEIAPYDLRGVLPTSGWLWLWHSFQYAGWEGLRLDFACLIFVPKKDEHPIVCRYWDGNVKQLKPRVENELRALPVYFMESFCGSAEGIETNMLGPEFFSYEDLEDDGFLRPSRDAAMDAAMTLLCIRRLRESIMSRLPKEIVTKIARDVYDSNNTEWGKPDPWKAFRPTDGFGIHHSKEEAPLEERVVPLYRMGMDDACGYEDATFYLSVVIGIDDARNGRYHQVMMTGNTD